MTSRCFSASLALTLAASPAFSAVRTWSGAGTNDNLTTPANWLGATPPAASAPFDAATFTGTARTNPSTATAVNFDSVFFSPAAGPFTIRGPGLVRIGNANLTAGGVTNSSAWPQRFSGPVSHIGGALVAEAADLVFEGTFNVGDGLNLRGNDTVVDGGRDVWLRGGLQGAGGGTTQGGLLFKRGRGTLHLTTNSPAWNGNVTVYDGAVRITAPQALGSAAGATFIDGMNWTGRVEVLGALTVAEPFQVMGRVDRGTPTPHLVNLAGTNTLSGNFNFQAGGGRYGIECTAGQLTVSGQIRLGDLGFTRELRLGGNGVGFLSGPILASNAVVPLVKYDGGAWILSGPGGHSGETVVLGGRLAANSAAALSNSPAFVIGPGAVLDLAAIPGGFTVRSNRALRGAGTVLGNVTVQGLVTPGPAPAMLTFSNALTLTGVAMVALDRGAVLNAGRLVAPSLTLGGALVVTNAGPALEADDEFRLFTAATAAGNFTNIALPTLEPGLVWDTSRLQSEGLVRVQGDGSPPAPPRLTVQPQSLTLECGPDAAAFTVSATGAAPLAYQWRKAGAPIAGATQSRLSLAPLTPAQQGGYDVVVTNIAGAVTSAVATLTVVDTRAPVLSLAGANPFPVECHTAFTDPGATATDVCSGALPVSVSGAVNTNTPGSYMLTCRATDAAGNSATLTRAVTVVDTQPPVLSLIGSSAVTVECHEPFTDLGATAHDACGGSRPVTVSGVVNTNVPGAYTLSYRASDASGNSNTVTRLVTVVDTRPPVVTLLGPSAVTVECHEPFTDLGATAHDACGGSRPVTVSGVVNTNVPGAYTLSYRASDPSGNSNTVTRLVTVADTRPPLLTVLGANPMTVNLGAAFVDPGASAVDACAGGLPVTVSGTVNVGLAGAYTLTYRATDPQGNTITATRVVNVVGGQPPAITTQPASQTVECSATAYLLAAVSGASPLRLQWHHGALPLSGATNGLLTFPVVTAAMAGDYWLLVTNQFGRATSAVARLTVPDRLPPWIVLSGPAALTVECHTPFSDPGASADDLCAGPLPVTTVGAVDPNTPGVYTLTYRTADAAGNTGSATRTVTVRDTRAPVLTLHGPTALTVECHSFFNDPGASASDLCAGALPVTRLGAVDTNTPGLYTLTYQATDAAGNLAAATRSVVVADTLPPVVTLQGPAALTLECPDAFDDPGATAFDTCGGNLAVTVAGTVAAGVPGLYTLTYRATDAAGNTATATRAVRVVDSAPPVIVSAFGQLELPADAACGATLPDVTGPVFLAATDACGGAMSIGQSPVAGSRLALGTNAVVLTVRDAAGNASTSTNQVVVRDLTAPLILASPLSVTTNAGASVVFQVTAQGCSPLRYQWLFGGVPLPAGTGAVLILNNVQPGQAGQYAARVTSDGGSTLSVAATLALSPAPPVAEPRITGIEVRSDGQVELRFRGEAAGTYRVQRTARPGVGRSWVVVGTGVPDALDPTAFSFVDPRPPVTNAFYRVMRP